LRKRHTSDKSGQHSIEDIIGITPRFIKEGIGRDAFDLVTFWLCLSYYIILTLVRQYSSGLSGQVKDAIRQSQEQSRDQYNRHRSPAPKYKEGDLVMLSSDDIHWPSETNTPEAFKAKYIGPLRVKSVDLQKFHLPS
jgi:hypothetical protein